MSEANGIFERGYRRGYGVCAETRDRLWWIAWLTAWEAIGALRLMRRELNGDHANDCACLSASGPCNCPWRKGDGNYSEDLERERDALRAALEAIRDDPHQTYDPHAPSVGSETELRYRTGVEDGHRCAAAKARAALAEVTPAIPKDGG